MGNDCCTSRGAIEPLERYFGVPLSTLCTYEASLLSINGPTAAHAFHVAMIDASGGGTNRHTPQTRPPSTLAHGRNHNVPLLVLTICARLRTVGLAVPCTVQHFTNSTMQQWVDRSRLAINHTFITDKKQWKEWKKNVTKRRAQQRNNNAGDDDDGSYEHLPLNPVGKVLEVSSANGVQCCALIAYFLKQLPAPLIPPVMLTELERTLVVGSSSESVGLAAFSELWNTTFASSYPTEHATLGSIADLFYLLAAPRTASSGIQLHIKRSLEHAVENDLWRSTIDAFMRSSDWIRAFTHGTTRPNRAPESTRATKELLYRAIGDAVFCVRYRPPPAGGDGDAAESSRRRDAAHHSNSRGGDGGGASGHAGAGATGGSGGPSSGTSSQPPSREPYQEGRVQPTGDAEAAANLSSVPQAASGSGPASPTPRATGGEELEQAAAAAAAGRPASSSSSSASSDDDNGSDDERRVAIGPSVGGGAMSGRATSETFTAHRAGSKSISPPNLPEEHAAHDDDGNASVGMFSDGGHASHPHHGAATARSRQSSVAVSALSATPHLHELHPLSRHSQNAAQEMLEDDDTIHGGTTGGGVSERESKKKKKPLATGPSAALRLELAKAAFSTGAERPAPGASKHQDTYAATHDPQRDVNTTRTTTDNTLTTHMDDTSGPSAAFSPREAADIEEDGQRSLPRRLDGSVDVKTRFEMFMVEASEIMTTLQQDVEEAKLQLRRCATLVDDALPHRGFRDRTQQTLEELATHGAEIGDEVLSLKKQVSQLQQQLDLSNKDRDCLAAEAAAARFSASEVILKFVDMERALLHHQQSIRYLERKVMDADDGMVKADTNSRTLRVDVDALQRRVLCLRDHL
jgi:hypothetical protein